MKLHTTEVESCTGVFGWGKCPAGHWVDVNRSIYHCSISKRDVDFDNKPKGMDCDEYTPKWCKLPDKEVKNNENRS